METPSRGLSAASVYVAAATFLGAAYFVTVLVATGGAPGQALRATLMALVPAVALAFVTFRAGRRARWFEGGKARLVTLHAALGIGYSGLWSAVVIALFSGERWLTRGGARFEIRPELIGWYMFSGLLLYASVAGTAFGLDTAARLRDERARSARAETLRVRAELAALRAQLNPHFLFNTLHTVLGLVRRDPALAEEALQDLGDVLRYSLNVQSGHDHVALREEMEFVDRYLAIERVRLGERLRVEQDVSSAALACRLPAFTLQPVVENAIRYAVASRAQGGRVRIEAWRDDGDGRLRVVVSDDGGGAAPPPSGGAGRGLALVRQRLEAAFGPEAELRAERTDVGFVVTVKVPQPAGGAA
ncbi:MAG TPA: histidine kinase [Haliangiales bacterium]|nr:histidine kinase [Haliangiales bacterium]